MKKKTKITIFLCITSVIIFFSLNMFFPYNDYYFSLEYCEKNCLRSLSCNEIVAKCSSENYIYEVLLNEKNELYIVQIMSSPVFGYQKYKAIQGTGYSIEKALNYYDQTLEVKWTNYPEINWRGSKNVFSWCLVRDDETCLSETYEYINYNNEKCVLYYKINSLQ